MPIRRLPSCLRSVHSYFYRETQKNLLFFLISSQANQDIKTKTTPPLLKLEVSNHPNVSNLSSWVVHRLLTAGGSRMVCFPQKPLMKMNGKVS